MHDNKIIIARIQLYKQRDAITVVGDIGLRSSITIMVIVLNPRYATYGTPIFKSTG